MDSTSISLLQRLRKSNQEAAWERFVNLYAPLIFHWGKSQGFNGSDAADLVQEVMAILVAKLPEFEYDPKRSFRSWLKTVTVNKARDLFRREAARPTSNESSLKHVAVADNVDLFGESEYRRYLVGRSLKLMQAEFRESTWKACWMHVVEGKSAAVVADELGLTANAVYVAKSRIFKRLREEFADLMN